MLNGGLVYLGQGLHEEEGVFHPQAAWTVLIGGMVVDSSEEAPVLQGWSALPGTGRVRLTPGPTHWHLVAAWRNGSRCLSVAMAIPSLAFAAPLLRMAKDPHVVPGMRLTCDYEATNAGVVRGGCRTAPG